MDLFAAGGFVCVKGCKAMMGEMIGIFVETSVTLDTWKYVHDLF